MQDEDAKLIGKDFFPGPKGPKNGQEVMLCSKDWFMEWPQEALRSVATHFLQKAWFVRRSEVLRFQRLRQLLISKGGPLRRSLYRSGGAGILSAKCLAKVPKNPQGFLPNLKALLSQNFLSFKLVLKQLELPRICVQMQESVFVLANRFRSEV